ncbi:lipopolysaccharide cholinephosphotransferase licd, partial [Biomphalaria glabrata]
KSYNLALMNGKMRRLWYAKLLCKVLTKPLLLSCLAMANVFVLLYSISSSQSFEVPPVRLVTRSSRILTVHEDRPQIDSHSTLLNKEKLERKEVSYDDTQFKNARPHFGDDITKHHNGIAQSPMPINMSSYQTKDYKPKLKRYFLYRNTDVLEKQFRDLLEMFDNLLTDKDVGYFLYGGSLLGSYRHHGLIPWDDDVDVMVSFSERPLLRHLLNRLAPKFELSAQKTCSWKLYPASGLPLKGLAWKWPYLDIFFYQENATHIWDVCASYISEFSFNKSVVFPLRRRPFLGLKLLAPLYTKAVIENNYIIEDCQSSTFIHRWEIQKDPIIVPCSWLHSIHPFVTRTFTDGGCNETLVHQGKIINVFLDRGIAC